MLQPKKNGTGLGLSIVNKIINDHNGKLNFVSIPNGAKVEITDLSDNKFVYKSHFKILWIRS